MEYFLGSVATLISVAVFNIFLRKGITNKKLEMPILKYSQSHIHVLLKPFMPSNSVRFKPIKESQSLKYHKDIYIKIMVMENKAYWIRDNTLFVADVVDGELVKETSRQVDTMSMDKVQLEKVMFVVEQLTEDSSNDHGSSG
jgi:hypothetical protein